MCLCSPPAKKAPGKAPAPIKAAPSAGPVDQVKKVLGMRVTQCALSATAAYAVTRMVYKK